MDTRSRETTELLPLDISLETALEILYARSGGEPIVLDTFQWASRGRGDAVLQKVLCAVPPVSFNSVVRTGLFTTLRGWKLAFSDVDNNPYFNTIQMRMAPPDATYHANH